MPPPPPPPAGPRSRSAGALWGAALGAGVGAVAGLPLLGGPLWAALNTTLPELVAALLRLQDPIEWVVTAFAVVPVALLGALLGAAAGAIAGFAYASWRATGPPQLLPPPAA